MKGLTVLLTLRRNSPVACNNSPIHNGKLTCASSISTRVNINHFWNCGLLSELGALLCWPDFVCFFQSVFKGPEDDSILDRVFLEGDGEDKVIGKDSLTCTLGFELC